MLHRHKGSLNYRRDFATSFTSSIAAGIPDVAAIVSQLQVEIALPRSDFGLSRLERRNVSMAMATPLLINRRAQQMIES